MPPSPAYLMLPPAPSQRCRYWLLELGIAYSKRRGPRSGTLLAPSVRATVPGAPDEGKDPVVPAWSTVPGAMKALLLSLVWIEVRG